MALLHKALHILFLTMRTQFFFVEENAVVSVGFFFDLYLLWEMCKQPVSVLSTLISFKQTQFLLPEHQTLTFELRSLKEKLAYMLKVTPFVPRLVCLCK